MLCAYHVPPDRRWQEGHLTFVAVFPKTRNPTSTMRKSQTHAFWGTFFNILNHIPQNCQGHENQQRQRKCHGPEEAKGPGARCDVGAGVDPGAEEGQQWKNWWSAESLEFREQWRTNVGFLVLTNVRWPQVMQDVNIRQKSKCLSHT